jgi:Pyruvate/2-oxoacid:ferredoxin oxidoreductase delta subunit
MAQLPRGHVTINGDECKGCGLCVDACPPECLELEPELNAYGIHPAHYKGMGCTGCGICFYACPEPGAITVYRAAPPKRVAETAQQEEAHATAV